MIPQTSKLEWLKVIVPRREAMIQLAEESCELAQAATKYYRLSSEALPTPYEETDILKQLKEEMTDIMVAAAVAGVKMDGDMFDRKVERWAERIQKNGESTEKDICVGSDERENA